MGDLLQFNSNGIYCPAADVYIDPWRPVEKALITHAHSDHARFGMRKYLAHPVTAAVMRQRLGADIAVQEVPYGQSITINQVNFSFHPAGHIPGSAQIRVEHKGEVWVASGDYKTAPDKLCAPFEPVRCHAFITESTFGLPVYNWSGEHSLEAEINAWWQNCAATGKTAVLLGYALGKAQRLLSLLTSGVGPIWAHGAVYNTTETLRMAGTDLPNCQRLEPGSNSKLPAGSLVLAPPGVLGTTWLKRLQPAETALASGWMALRGARRRRNADRGFILSDHADWNGLNTAIAETGAQRIFVTHGYTNLFTRWLREQGYQAEAASTEYEGELAEVGEGQGDTDNSADAA